jgi:hypothetical protein
MLQALTEVFVLRDVSVPEQQLETGCDHFLAHYCQIFVQHNPITGHCMRAAQSKHFFVKIFQFKKQL